LNIEYILKLTLFFEGFEYKLIARTRKILILCLKFLLSKDAKIARPTLLPQKKGKTRRNKMIEGLTIRLHRAVITIEIVGACQACGNSVPEGNASFFAEETILWDGISP